MDSPSRKLRERPPPRPPWTVLSLTSDPDPLDVDFYGQENAPLHPSAYSYHTTYDDRHTWQSFRKDASHHAVPDGQSQTNSRDESDKKGSPKPKLPDRNSASSSSTSSHRMAAAANAATNAARQAGPDPKRPSVNPHGVYKENLAKVETDSVRLIRLPSRDNPLELKVFPLKLAPKYAALSYSWGDCSLMTKLSVEPSLPITEELSQALKTITSSGKYEFIWVDAVSINQSHPAEKSHQVQKMRKIYERADAVYIWLGSHLDEVYSSAPTTRPSTPSSVEPSTRDDIVRNFLRVLHHQNSGTVWWTRLWTIQELVSAIRPVVCFGSFIVHWDTFVSAVTKIEDDGALFADKHARYDSHPQRYHGQLQGAKERVKQLYDLRKHLRSSPGGEEILDLLRLTSTANASNPRDKVYGILGLATRRDQTGIPIDYGFSVARVFAETALHIIRSKASMDVLVDQWNRRCGVPYDREAAKSLPSWVPDFSRPVRRIPESTARTKRYNASGARPPSVQLRNNLGLQMEAVYFDEIEATMVNCIDEAEPGFELDTFRLITLPSLETLVTPVLRRKSSPNDWRSRLCRDESLARALVLDQHDGREAPAPDTFHTILEIMQQTATEESHATETMLDQNVPAGCGEAHKFLQNVSRTMHKRAVFVTHSGFVGVGPKALQKGDIVVVPLGASVPFVLRKTERKGRYTLVVDCFVHGIMYGEILKPLDACETTTEYFTLV